MDVIWIISFKITTEIEVRKHAFCVLLRRRAMFYQFVFLPSITRLFSWNVSLAQSALNGVSMLSFFLYLLFCFICLFVVQLFFFYSYIFFCLLASFPSFLPLALTLCFANRVPFPLGSFILKFQPFNKCVVSLKIWEQISLCMLLPVSTCVWKFIPYRKGIC